MIFILTVILTYFIYAYILQRIQNKFIRIVVSYFVSAIFVSFFTFSICLDGWNSSSIGTQGACSHHGGVTTKLDGAGLILFFVCLFIFSVQVFIKYKKSNSDLKEKPDKAIEENVLIHNADARQVKSRYEYCYRTESRDLEQAIKDFCSTRNVSFQLNHEIRGSSIVACFRFYTKDILDEVSNFSACL